MTDDNQLFDPKIDAAFKMIFSEKSDGKIALMNLLNCILDLEDNNQITDLEYVNTHEPVEALDEKSNVLDIKVHTAQKYEINIEMQVKSDDDYKKRCIYYVSKMYSRQPIKSKQYKELNKCILISILNFILLKETNRLHNTFRFMEINKKFEFSDTIEIHFVELPKIDSSIKINSFEDINNMSVLEKWSYFLKFASNRTKYDIIKYIIESEEGIKMAYKSLIKVSADERKRAIYDSREKAINDYNSGLYSAREEGLEEGKKQGLEEGLEQGRKEGLIEVAKNLLANGMDINEIVAVTGLSVEEIHRNSHKI